MINQYITCDLSKSIIFHAFFSLSDSGDHHGICSADVHSYLHCGIHHSQTKTKEKSKVSPEDNVFVLSFYTRQLVESL